MPKIRPATLPNTVSRCRDGDAPRRRRRYFECARGFVSLVVGRSYRRFGRFGAMAPRFALGFWWVNSWVILYGATQCTPPTLPLRGQAPNFGNTQLICASRRHQSLVVDHVVEGARPRRGGVVCAFSQNRHFGNCVPGTYCR